MPAEQQVSAERGSDLVPLSERLHYLRALRVVLAALTVVDAVLLPGPLRRSLGFVAAIALAYATIGLVVEGSWRLAQRPGRWLFGSLLGLDALYLAAATYLTGGWQSPVRYLALVHLAAVTLLASYRTGLQVALCHTVAQWGFVYAQQLGGSPSPSGTAGGREWWHLVAFTLALWAVGITIAALNAVNERELRRRRFELEQLALMGRALEDANDPLAVGDVLLDCLSETFGFRRMALFEVVDDSPRLLTCRGLLDAAVVDFRLRPGSVLAAANDERRTALVDEIDPVIDPWIAAIMPDARNLALVPLIADGVVGVLVAETGQRYGGRIERRVIATTERFTGHAALTMRNTNLLARMQQMAVTDGLTQLANRRSFDRSLERELGRAARTDGRLSVVLLDIDQFKALNDEHGHLVGDAVLRQVAVALRLCGREYDTIARYGGEEFAAVLPGCSSGLALQVAERLRQAVEAAATDVPVTASAGVATYPYDGVDVDALLSAADQALYASKRAGRNRVSSAEQLRQRGEPAVAAGSPG